jgi:hypothetical protein
MDCKFMITTVDQYDCSNYFVVVHGIDAQTYERMAVHFECRRGGVRPTDQSRFISIPVTVDTLGSTLAWVKTELNGRHYELHLIVSVATNLSWGEVLIPPQIALLAGQAEAAIKIAFQLKRT